MGGKMLIDDKGRLFGKVNIIDFCVGFAVITFILSALAIPVRYKFWRKEKVFYTQAYKCPNCTGTIIEKIPFGSPIQYNIETICEECGCAVVVNEEDKVEIPEEDPYFYNLPAVCPNCGKQVELELPYGTPVGSILEFVQLCPYCKCEITLIDRNDSENIPYQD
jgi:hypothetical protein